MKKTITTFLILFTASLFSQEIKFVKANSGLIVRDAPHKNAQRIGKLKNNTRVYIIKKTEISLEIKDNGKIINGNWIEVKSYKEDIKGYVFSGFLTDKIPNKGTEKGNYYLTKIDSITKNEYWENLRKNIKTKPSFIYLRNKNHINLVQLEIGDLEMYEGTTLIVKKENELKNIIQIIKIESSYSACCSNTDEYFYLVDKNKQLISLPVVENNHCDGPEPYFTYLFPSDDNGKKDLIIYAKIIPKEDADDKVEILKTYSWNGENIVVIK
ncbi:SH3 domain-containing protein [Polaribacter sp. R77954]|uniref:SH3 domain-containing protein n=1 Tax=Polaribacter sp. R77954 TaxID=3093870 RepID=UPI0037C6D395